jgi:hypothetical protein
MTAILALLRYLFGAPTQAAMVRPVGATMPRPQNISGRIRTMDTTTKLPGLFEEKSPATEVGELVRDYAQAVVLNAPAGWETLIAYGEARLGQLVGARSAFVLRSWVDGKPYRSDGTSKEEFEAFATLIGRSSEGARPWSAFRLIVFSTGEYRTDHWCDSTPLLDEDVEELERRLDGGGAPGSAAG